MSKSHTLTKAGRPEELAQFFLQWANQGDVEGLVALYEPEAVLALPDGHTARGSEEIRKFYATLLASRPHFDPGIQQRPLQSGDLALTSSILVNGNVTAEIARRQPDGTWLWVVDQPAFTANGR